MAKDDQTISPPISQIATVFKEIGFYCATKEQS